MAGSAWPWHKVAVRWLMTPALLGAALLGAAPAVACPAYDQTLALSDTARNRTIMARLTLPAGAGRLATVVWAPGMGGTTGAGTVWANAWRDAGLGVVRVQFPGADASVYASPDPKLRQARILAAVTPEAQAVRVADIRFVLDELARRRADACGAGRIDADRLGLAGHSIGAWTVMALAGQGDGQLADRRFRAFVAMSPTALPLAERAGAYARIGRPLLIISGSRDGLVPPGDAAALAATRDARIGMWPALPADGRKALLWLEGADHMAFAGNRQGPDALTGRVNAAVLAATTGWWRRWLQAGPAPARPPLGPADAWEQR
jgi:predicted dienelactone hydrolase